MAKDAKFGQKLYRVTTLDALGCWYGYMYYRNDTRMQLEQTLTLKFSGVSVVNRNVVRNEQGEPTI